MHSCGTHMFHAFSYGSPLTWYFNTWFTHTGLEVYFHDDAGLGFDVKCGLSRYSKPTLAQQGFRFSNGKGQEYGKFLKVSRLSR